MSDFELLEVPNLNTGNCLQEAEKLEPDIHPAYPYVDYSEKRSLPVSIPDYHYVERNGERFAVS